MMSKRKLIALVAASALFGVTAIDSAMARCSSGEIANFLCGMGMSQQDANNMDRLNDNLGHPAEAVGTAVLTYFGL